MTDSTAAATCDTAAQSFWEDVIDIFAFSPAEVLRRRQHGSAWPAMLFVALSIGVIFFATFNTLSPVFEAEFQRNTLQAMEKSGNAVPPEMVARMRDTGLAVTRYGITVIMFAMMFAVGVASWILGRLFGSRQTFHAAMVVAGWAYMPRVAETVLNGVQGLVMDTSKLTSHFALAIGPARFLDVDTANPLLLQFLGRLDLVTIWVTVLLSVGLYVTGHVSKPKAVAFGFLIWFLGSLTALRAGYMAM